MLIFSKPALPVGRISFLFGIQQPTVVCRATINFVSEVKIKLYENVMCTVFAPICFKLSGLAMTATDATETVPHVLTASQTRKRNFPWQLVILEL
jgi:hypothetical protein